ncbi:MAG: hypothetical protein IJ880_08535 [Bacilli bacterium]|nr:hypothetical protein [Bacilli bacterium]
MIDIKTQEILKEFKNAVEAIEYLGYGNASNIRCCASGKTKTAFGYIWKYKENK